MTGFSDMMRMEISAPSLRSVGRFWRWFLDGLLLAIPDAFKSIGWRPAAEFVDLSTPNSKNRWIVEQSWLGLTRNADGNISSNLPLWVNLSADDYFQTTIGLPKEAKGSIEDAVALRLDQVSPIPSEQAAIAIGEIKTIRQSRLEVDIALARRSDLNRIRSLYPDRTIEQITAGPTRQGKVQFIFEKKETPSPFPTTQSMGLLAAALLCLAIAFDFHLDRRLQQSERQENELRSGLRNLRPAVAVFNDIELGPLRQQSGDRLGSIIDQANNAMAQLPSGAHIADFSYSANRLTLTGFAPENSIASEQTINALHLSPSERPGLKRFTYSQETAKRHD